MNDTATFPNPLTREPLISREAMREARATDARATDARRLVPARTDKYRDNIQTPRYLADQIVGHFRPSGHVLEACAGDGAFLHALDSSPISRASWCEIRANRLDDPEGGARYGNGRSFFDWEERVSWVITNPPYSMVTPFLEHAMHVSDNVVFLILLNAAFFTSRLAVMQDLNFGLREVLVLETPPEWKSLGLGFGVPFAAVHWQRNYSGGVRGFGGLDLTLPARRPRKRLHSAPHSAPHSIAV